MSYFIKPNREQLRLQPIDVEKLIAEDHSVRFFWKICEKLELKELYADYKISEESEGRPAYDPKVLLCLWLYGYSVGIQTTRELSEMCKCRADFMWLCGDVTPEYRALAYFRTNHNVAIEKAFCEMVIALKEAGLIKEDTFFQDGTKITADASKNSFKKKNKLEDEWQKAEKAYEEFIKNEETMPAEKKARKERTLKDKEERIRKAIQKVNEIREKREKLDKRDREKFPPSKAKASMTDAECQFMKMSDGAKKPGYNAQLCIDKESEIITGNEVNSEAGDTKSLIPMIDKVKKNLELEEIKGKYVTDGGYFSNDNIENAINRGAKGLIIPINTNTNSEKAKEIKDIAESELGKKKLNERKTTIERIIGYIKGPRMKFRRFNVRGLMKVGCEWIFICMAYNFIRYIEIIKESP